MEHKEKKPEAMMIDDKFSMALKAIQVAQHQVKAGQEVNLTNLLDDVKRSIHPISYT
jgi:hypothetical protein